MGEFMQSHPQEQIGCNIGGKCCAAVQSRCCAIEHPQGFFLCPPDHNLGLSLDEGCGQVVKGGVTRCFLGDQIRFDSGVIYKLTIVAWPGLRTATCSRTSDPKVDRDFVGHGVAQQLGRCNHGRLKSQT